MASFPPFGVAAMRKLDPFDVAVIVAFLAALAILISGCAQLQPPCYPAAATRCAIQNGISVRETCGADGVWWVTLDCGQVSRWSGEEYQCQPASGGGATCLPVR